MEIVEEMNWVIDLKEQLLPLTQVNQKEVWMKQSIYRVPARIKDMNVKAYEPQMVSIGPYHHDHPNLKPMEHHKRRTLLRFLERSNKPMEKYGAALEEVVQELMDSYEELEERWRDKDQFLQLMLIDSCFLLEIIEIMHGIGDDFYPFDPVFSILGVWNTFPYIVPDMLMLENQVPLLALARLMALANDLSFEEGEALINGRVLKLFFPPGVVLADTRMGLHMLDVCRKVVIQDPWAHIPVTPKLGVGQAVRSATDLHEAGVIFRRSETPSIKAISFQNGVLSIPVFIIERGSETMYLNTIAFERLRPEAGHDMRSFIVFMFGLVNSAKDVALLKSLGLVQSTLGSDEAVADLLYLLTRDVFLHPSSRLYIVRGSLNEHYIKNMNRWKKRMRTWRRNLKLNYFSSPWTFISVIAAFLILILTFTQTFYSVGSYYKSNSNG